MGAGNPQASAEFAAMGQAFQQFQDAVETCQRMDGEVEGTKSQLLTVYKGGSANVYVPKLQAWQDEFKKVQGALGRMTLELSRSKDDYQRQEDENKEISNAISAQLLG
jgi:WXG100 family type VII secretion target